MASRRMRRRPALMLAVGLLAGTIALLSPATANACGASRASVFNGMRNGSLEYLTLRTFYVEVALPKKVYAIGEVVPVKVKVTRPAKEDPLGLGIPIEDRPFVEPAEGAIVGVGLHIGRVFLPGAAITNEKGIAKVNIKLEKWAPRGKVVDASVYAWKIVQDTQCATIQEDGYRTMPRFFRTGP